MNRRWLQTGLLSLALLAAAGQALPADPAPTERSRNGGARPTGPDVVTLNLVNTDIEGVVKVVGEITGKNFVLDPRVKGTVNIVSARPISRALVYQVFLSAIRLQGFTAVEERGVVMIVPETDAKYYRGTTSDKPRVEDVVQTRVFRLQHQSAAQVVPVLRPLIPTNNTITAYPSSNTLVVTDYASNLQRIERIIEAIDQPHDQEPIIIRLQHASAIDVAQTVSRLLAEQAPAAGDPTQRFTVTADSRTNSLLAHVGSPARLLRVRQLVAMLDSPTSAGGNIHVIYLKNAVAVKVAEVLRAVYTGDAGAPSAAARPTATPLGQGAAAVAAPAAAMQPGIIQADAATNSIIITAPDAIYNNLRAAVEKLDVRRAQVYVEALIAEVTADKAAEFGIQWQSLTGLNKSGTQGFGGTNFGTAGQNIIGIAQNPAAAGPGLNVGLVKGKITIPGVGEVLNLNLLLRALQSDSNANILSTPTLLTLDNEEAKIVIGQNVPFITGQYAVSAAATTPTPFQTIERKDVGLTLRIKPQVSEGGAIRMQIFQEVSTVTDATNASGLITNKRSVESTVLVDDGQIVAIGGLIQDNVIDGVEKVPGLGDIPLLGGLFRYNTRSHTKTNLMVFLRPVVLRSTQSAESITADRYDYIMGEQLKVRPAPTVLPDFQTPVLPPRQGATPPASDKSATDGGKPPVPARTQ
ncbi:MAG: type II secretion system protein GspD [Betaproteobacteria bacterium RIFCSPLOWO2_02_FULL_68_150]|nr:MAG: type II secretion system protein GspD [Betaproteobacteria bacterium RIFCSPLOWO2_02_FULL_68_150]